MRERAISHTSQTVSATTISMAAVGPMQLAPLHEAVHTAAAPAACLAAAAVSTGVVAAAVVTAAAAQQAVHAVAIAQASKAASRQRDEEAHSSSRSAHAPAAPLTALHEPPAHKHHHTQRLAKTRLCSGPHRVPAAAARLA